MKVQDKSCGSTGRLLRVAASFNVPLQPIVKNLRFLPSAELARYDLLFNRLACTALTWKP